MRKKVLGYSLMSMIALSAVSANAAPEDWNSIKALQARLEKSQQSGQVDQYTMGCLAIAYFKASQFEQGREMFGRVVNHEQMRDLKSELASTLASWADAEYDDAHDYAAAEKLQMRSLEVYDRLSVSSRIQGYRMSIRFFSRCGQSAKAAKQTAALAQMLGASDKSTLFPTPKCPGCGRG